MVQGLTLPNKQLLAGEDVSRAVRHLHGLVKVTHLRQAAAVVDPRQALPLLVVQRLVNADGALRLLPNQLLNSMEIKPREPVEAVPCTNVP